LKLACWSFDPKDVSETVQLKGIQDTAREGANYLPRLHECLADTPLVLATKHAVLGGPFNFPEKLPEVSGYVSLREPERKHLPEQQPAAPEVATARISTRLPSPAVGDARISQELPGLKRFDSMAVAFTVPGSDQSYLSRSHTRPKGRGHGFPSVTSAHVSPRSWSVEVLDVDVPPQVGSARREVVRGLKHALRTSCALRDYMNSGHSGDAIRLPRNAALRFRLASPDLPAHATRARRAIRRGARRVRRAGRRGHTGCVLGLRL
jgi:hypothetical protein